MKYKFVNVLEDSGHIGCICNPGETYGLHHQIVGIYHREEDGPTTLALHQCSHEPSPGRKIVHNVSFNPSRRRDAVVTYHWCENCDNLTAFSIVQHKGSTLYENYNVTGEEFAVVNSYMTSRTVI